MRTSRAMKGKYRGLGNQDGRQGLGQRWRRACHPGAPTYFRSALQTWVSLDLPEPHGSIKYCESITTARTPPMSWASSCSTDRDTRAHIPLGRSVLQVLQGSRPRVGVTARRERRDRGAEGHTSFPAPTPGPVARAGHRVSALPLGPVGGCSDREVLELGLGHSTQSPALTAPLKTPAPREWWVQNRQEEVKNSIGHVEAKELICTTHGHELKGGIAGGRGVQGGGE